MTHKPARLLSMVTLLHVDPNVMIAGDLAGPGHVVSAEDMHISYTAVDGSVAALITRQTQEQRLVLVKTL